MKKSQLAFLCALIFIAPHMEWGVAMWFIAALNALGFALAVWEA